MKRALLGSLLTVAVPVCAHAQAAAARVGDVTSHGGVIVGPGVPTVLIESRPAAVMGDQTTCPLVDPITMVPHVGGPITTGSTTVFIGGKPAARMGDSNTEVGASATIVAGAMTVLIGP
jgi:uncharacterized Zn-binding protein involved in type VI secretion